MHQTPNNHVRGAFTILMITNSSATRTQSKRCYLQNILAVTVIQYMSLSECWYMSKRKRKSLLYLWKRTDLTSVTTSRLALYPAHTMATWMVCGGKPGIVS